MFDHWREFYLLLGTAVGALIGLLFVVASLTKHLDRQRAERGANIYMSPVVFHFSVVLLLSALALAPDIAPHYFFAAAGLCALLGIGWSVRIIFGIVHQMVQDAPHWTDKWYYGVVPGIVYLVLGGVSVAYLLGTATDPLWVALVMIALMLVSIRNAWDLVTFLAQEADPDAPDDD